LRGAALFGASVPRGAVSSAKAAGPAEFSPLVSLSVRTGPLNSALANEPPFAYDEDELVGIDKRCAAHQMPRRVAMSGRSCSVARSALRFPPDQKRQSRWPGSLSRPKLTRNYPCANLRYRHP
jgi:hypothetical protein